MKILEVDISSYSKTTKLMDEILEPENQYSRVIFKDAIVGTFKYKFKLVADLEKTRHEYDWDIPHYYYTMTQLKRGLYPKYSEKIKNILELSDYGIEEEIGFYIHNDTVEIGTIIQFKGEYEIHGQRSIDYKSGGWGNYVDPILYVVGFIVDERF